MTESTLTSFSHLSTALRVAISFLASHLVSETFPVCLVQHLAHTAHFPLSSTALITGQVASHAALYLISYSPDPLPSRFSPSFPFFSPSPSLLSDMMALIEMDITPIYDNQAMSSMLISEHSTVARTITIQSNNAIIINITCRWATT